MGNLLTDKYAEGSHHRFYAGCDNIDSIEDLANQRARELFGGMHAQPHSGGDANLVAFWAILPRGPGSSIGNRQTARRGPDSLAGDWYELTPEQWGTVRQALGRPAPCSAWT